MPQDTFRGLKSLGLSRLELFWQDVCLAGGHNVLAHHISSRSDQKLKTSMKMENKPRTPALTLCCLTCPALATPVSAVDGRRLQFPVVQESWHRQRGGGGGGGVFGGGAVRGDGLLPV